MFYEDARMMKMVNVNDKKVYCKNCKYYKKRDFGYTIERLCLHPNNIICKDTFEKIECDYEKSPKELNKNNDCKWFEKRVVYFLF